MMKNTETVSQTDGNEKWLAKLYGARERRLRERERGGRRETERKRGRQNKEPLMKQTKRIKILSAAFAFNKWPAEKTRLDIASG